ncbi:hypothetical protein, partial [Cohnella xylanilytica]|uniref:hypothetical protein n=1 Tax=Cohnella xylanilytica TaxID=557555 RepID=UPI001BB332E1
MDEKAAMWVKESNWITHMIGKVEVGTKESNRITHMDEKAAMWVKESNWITHMIGKVEVGTKESNRITH